MNASMEGLTLDQVLSCRESVLGQPEPAIDHRRGFFFFPGSGTQDQIAAGIPDCSNWAMMAGNRVPARTA